MKLSKADRQRELTNRLKAEPFITDETLSEYFKVSIQTIRLDRMELGIPELRRRIKDVATQNHDEIKSLPIEDVIGEIIDIELDKSAISIIDIKEEHVFTRNGIARGHYLFAQANSLCVALINDELALTTKSNVQFKKSVKLNERVIAKATVIHKSKHIAKVDVTSTVHGKTVFQGQFEMYYSSEGENNG
ncbi:MULTISPECIES: transcription factor FapR [Mammaliicoccus]|uniref:Transcription factor FapR n=2 Tax=Mammaliicoccus sciuri TaxID=1296 RepID=A0ABT7HUN9_MAMSC|nr:MULTISPECIES: transcription factor FapR [Mammaliicoccus]MCJ0913643.1 transcription factor FapR [Mammaliicoccus sciuri]MDL0111093.1 transcription factor FapR [Mammaliicoccus sciuri]MDL0115847.1 transcription factor FapR [Mammaliicoccus sciuri]WQJ64877.1 transcription factor FapR [Mammaliicoccus sciuri]